MNEILKHLSKVPIQLLPDDCYETRNWKTFEMPVHCHPGIEINYILEGSCTYEIDGRTYDLKKRDLIMLDCMIPHCLKFASDTPGAVAGASFVQTDETLGESGKACTSQIMSQLARGKKVVVFENAKQILPSLKNLYEEYILDADAYYLNLLSMKLIFEAARLSQAGNPTQRQHVKKVELYIQENYSKITCVDDIAAYVGLNKGYLERIFKSYTGITVWNYLKNVRLKYAVKLLRTTDIPIGEIDEHLGINSRQTFYLMFQKRFGMSPQDYRKITQGHV